MWDERIGDLIETHKDELAFLDALDSGRPIGSVYFRDIAGSIDALSFFGGQARSRTAKVAVMPDEVVIHHELLEPMGVVAEIVPWNGPLLTGVQRLAAILAAGNVAIMKPSQTSALSFLRLAELLTEADLPPGVVTVLAGPGASVGEQLVAHPGVDMVSLTGGLETGPRILALAAPTLKRVSLELGGKNPDLVFGDAERLAHQPHPELGPHGRIGGGRPVQDRLDFFRGLLVAPLAEHGRSESKCEDEDG